MEVLGFPAQYEPSAIYDLIVRITDPAQVGAGFQADVVAVSTGEHTGTMLLTDLANTDLNPSDPEYLQHTAAGVADSVANWAAMGNAATYTFQWQAPAVNVGSVRIYAAGNAINNNMFSFGDLVYLTSVTAAAPPGPPTPTWDCPIPVNATCSAATRALRFTMVPPAAASGGTGSSAIKITPTDLQNPQPPNAGCCPPPDFSTFESASCSAAGEGNACGRWVGQQLSFLESIDSPTGGVYKTARLQCTPYYTDWENQGLITVIGAEIAPSSTFSVQAYGDSCKGAETGCSNTSPAVTMQTRRAGDVALNFNPPATTTQPDSGDVTAAVNKFKGLGGLKSVIQVQPNLPDANSDVNALDIGIIVDNFKGFAYPFPGPCVCPSTVPCNTTACASVSTCTGLYGAGATCVKTCTSGPRTGAACGNNKHCGTCDASSGVATGAQCDNSSQCNGGNCTTGVCNSQAFCRDKCGRCR